MFRLEQPITQNAPGLRLRATVGDDAGTIATAEVARRPRLRAAARPADPGRAAAPVVARRSAPVRSDDRAASTSPARWSTARRATPACAASRSTAKVKLNGEVVFQRLVLDQGYYADGIMTAPSDEALIDDIQLSMDGRLQRRAAAPEGVRGALPVPRRPARLPGVGRVRRLGLRRLRPDARAPAARDQLRRAVAGSAGARLLASRHHRLVCAERNLAAAARPHHRARRRDTRAVPGGQGDGYDRVRCSTPRATRTACPKPISTIRTTISTKTCGAKESQTSSSATPDWPRASHSSTPASVITGVVSHRSGRSRTVASRISSASSAASNGLKIPSSGRARKTTGSARQLGLWRRSHLGRGFLAPLRRAVRCAAGRP